MKGSRAVSSILAILIVLFAIWAFLHPGEVLYGIFGIIGWFLSASVYLVVAIMIIFAIIYVIIRILG